LVIPQKKVLIPRSTEGKLRREWNSAKKLGYKTSKITFKK
jgi:hypothetical protein